MIQIVTVYKLVCPIIHKVVYIGVTSKPLKERLTTHNGNSLQMKAWLKKLKDKKLKPIILPIEEMPVRTGCNYDKFEREAYWISVCKHLGVDIFNISKGYNLPLEKFVKIKDKQAQFITNPYLVFGGVYSDELPSFCSIRATPKWAYVYNQNVMRKLLSDLDLFKKIVKSSGKTPYQCYVLFNMNMSDKLRDKKFIKVIEKHTGLNQNKILSKS